MASTTDIKGEKPSATNVQPSSERRGSLVYDTQLAGEEDAAVLAKMGFVTPLCSILTPTNSNDPRNLGLTSVAQLQTGTPPKLQYDRGLWNRLCYYGPTSVDRQYVVILHSRWTRGPGLGMVPRVRLDLHRWLSHERPGELDAD